MESSLENVIVNSLVRPTNSIFEKLDCLRVQLLVWAKDIRCQRHGIKCELGKRLGELLQGDREDENMADIIDTCL